MRCVRFVVVGCAASASLVFCAAAAAQIPDVQTGAAINVTATSATVLGTVNPNGSRVSACDVQWGTDTTYDQGVPTACTPTPGGGNDAVAVSVTLSGLRAGSTYHYRFTATNGDGQSYGADASFTTPTPQHVGPAVTTGAVKRVTAGSATVTGTVDPNGSRVTSCRVQWGTSSSYQQGAPVACKPGPGAGDNPVAVTATLSHLRTDTTYHYRFVAQNGNGRTYGPDRTFRTPPSGAIATVIRLTFAPHLTGRTDKITATLRTVAGRPLAGQRLVITAGRFRLPLRTGRHGSVTFTVGLTAGVTVIRFEYLGTSVYAPTSSRLTVTVS
jgi:phosphodiesterase/alkaline phosphatase D-like protein